MDRGEHLRKLADTMERTQAAFDAGPATLARSYGPGKWTAKEILGHVTDHELITLTRLHFILAEDHPPIPPYTADLWPARLRYKDQDANLLKQLYVAARQNLMRLVETMTEAEFARTGRHPEYDAYTAEMLIQKVADHNAHHLTQIQAIREGRTWEPPRA
ncbi:MAG: DinB family protein [Planctomycetes bacterium]|nr:DinB family protein [Planctomycetota bacterium]